MPSLPPALAPYVASVVAYDLDAGRPGTHRGLPSTELTLVLPVEEPLDVAWHDDPGSRVAQWSSVSGLHTRPAVIRHGGRQRGVQVGLTAAGARALIGVPAGALAGLLVEVVELDDVAPGLRHLPDQLHPVPHGDRGRLVVQALHDALRPERAGLAPEVTRAIALLERGTPVQAVADDVGYTRRHLGTLVRAETGLTPKQLQRVARLQRSKRLLGRVPLAAVAARCGYADQAHLAREWADLAGCAPSTWVREEFPFVQDLEATTAGASPA